VSTLVFLPAWNEEENLPAVLEELRRELPEADLLVVDDGSTDATANVAHAHGAEVVSFGENRGLPAGIAAGYGYALEHGYDLCGRVDADGQHPVQELARLLALVREGECDVAVGSRFASGDGYAPYRYKPSLPVLARPYATEAPEVEALLRLNEEGLRVDEVPVEMRERAGGESKLRGWKALLVVFTVVGTLLTFLRRRR
jgi:glycosyltransferase involved in cell wall biosynthesis